MLLGSHPTAMGAFYVECDEAHLGDLGRRLVALAGPAMSLLLGAVAYAALMRVARNNRAGWLFTWLLGSLGLMSAAGYPLFSGVSGLGDLGTIADGALGGWTPQWPWRVGMTALGVIGYRAVLRVMWRAMAPQLGARDPAALKRQLRGVALPAYATGALVYLAIGLLNPLGLEMILLSVLPSSLGGSCGLLLFWQQARRAPVLADGGGPGLGFGRSMPWIGAAGLVVLAYAALFGPTLRG